MPNASRAGVAASAAPPIVHAVLRGPGRPLGAAGGESWRGAMASDRPVPSGASTTPLAIGERGGAEEIEAGRVADRAAAGAAVPPHLAFDLGSIRIHADARAAESARAVGARAYAVGRDLVFGDGEFRPDTASGRRVLAHELAHAARAAAGAPIALHRYEAPEHQDFGDTGLVELSDFLLTKEGAEFAKSLGNPASLGDLASDPFLKGKKFKVQGVDLSVGDIIAMAGDFFPTPADLLKASAEELKEIRDAIADERAGHLKGGKANERYQELTLKYIKAGKRPKDQTFIGMARVNAPHFTPTNRAAWKDLHKQALKSARATGRDAKALDAALLVDAFGGHFLTDAFASGHLFDKTKLEREIKMWVSQNAVAPPNPEMNLYYSIIGNDMPQVILKNIHDRLNAEGVEVKNKRGLAWKTFGDDHLKSAPDSLRIGALAVFESRRQVMQAARAGTDAAEPDYDALSQEVLDLLPDQASIDAATAKSVSYIPWAAQNLTPLIYRQRGAGALELKQRLGVAGDVVAPIIKANIETIADPHREKDLLRLEDLSRSANTGPLLAPQFTIAHFQ